MDGYGMITDARRLQHAGAKSKAHHCRKKHKKIRIFHQHGLHLIN